jgi:SpoVK/Ycf46/Vps4 family AAA+-type ATPase
MWIRLSRSDSTPPNELTTTVVAIVPDDSDEATRRRDWPRLQAAFVVTQKDSSSGNCDGAGGDHASVLAVPVHPVLYHFLMTAADHVVQKDEQHHYQQQATDGVAGTTTTRRTNQPAATTTGGWQAEPITTMIDLPPGGSGGTTVRVQVIHTTRTIRSGHPAAAAAAAATSITTTTTHHRLVTPQEQYEEPTSSGAASSVVWEPRTVVYDPVTDSILLVREIIISSCSPNDDDRIIVHHDHGCFRIPNDDATVVVVPVEEGCSTTPRPTTLRTCPGYEPLLDQLLHLIRMPPLIRPTGIFVHGCPGVGKTRLLECLLSHYNNYSPPSVNNVGGQFRIRQVSRHPFSLVSATTSSVPSSSLLSANVNDEEENNGVVLLIDDLDLILADNSDRNLTELEIALNNNNHNNSSVLIIAFGSELPPASVLTVGRLELVVNMLPPTQTQREIMLSDLLLRGPNAEADPAWIPNLAQLTAGCVAADLVQLQRSTCVISSGDNDNDDKPPPTTTYASYAEAAFSLVPSQWATLDVQKPARLLLMESSSSSSGQYHSSDKTIFHEAFRTFAGYDQMKERLFRAVVLPWRRQQQHWPGHTMNNNNNNNNNRMVDPPTGVLFHGPSGCGKTTAAIGLGSALGLAMIQVRATDVLDQYVGGSEQIVRTLFTRARQAAPCILFLDEIDSLAANRGGDDGHGGSSSGGGVMSRVLSTLLNEMDGVSSSGGGSAAGPKVLIVACTNRLAAIDSALLRPGRLEVHIAVGLPSATDIEAIVREKLQSTVLEAQLSTLAEKLVRSQSSGADVYGLCREAVYQSLRRTKTKPVVVTTQDLEAAALVQLGPT